MHDTERQFAKDNAKKFAQYYEEKTGQVIDEAHAEQMLLGDGYKMVDAAANKGPGVAGPAGDAVAVSFLAQYARDLFKAPAAEYNNPGQLGGPLTPEQAALPGAAGNPALGLGTAAVITGGLAAPALLAISGTPIFSSAGALGSGMWASPAGTAAISAGINAGAQYYQNGTINPVDVAVAAATGGAGAYGGFLWNVGANTVGGAAGTAINNRLNGESNSVAGNAATSGVFSSVGYGLGKLGESLYGSAIRPSINTPNWAGTGAWYGGGWNLFKPNATPVITGTTVGGLGQSVADPVIQSAIQKTKADKK